MVDSTFLVFGFWFLVELELDLENTLSDDFYSSDECSGSSEVSTWSAHLPPAGIPRPALRNANRSQYSKRSDNRPEFRRSISLPVRPRTMVLRGKSFHHIAPKGKEDGSGVKI